MDHSNKKRRKFFLFFPHQEMHRLSAITKGWDSFWQIIPWGWKNHGWKVHDWKIILALGLKSSWLKSSWLKCLGLTSSWLKSQGLKCPGLELGVVKSGVEISFTMSINLLNWCNLVSITKNVVFYAFLVVRIY